MDDETRESDNERTAPSNCRDGHDMPEDVLVRAAANFRHEPDWLWPVIHVTDATRVPWR